MGKPDYEQIALKMHREIQEPMMAICRIVASVIITHLIATGVFRDPPQPPQPRQT